jgi:hypothetical protein
MLIVLTCCASACSVSEYDYHHIEIEGGDFRVLEYGKPSKDSAHADFLSVTSIPVLYSLSRDSYTVWARVPFEDANAYLEFSAESDSGESLLLHGNVEDSCFGTLSEYQGMSFGSTDATRTVSYGWFRRNRPDCQTKTLPIDEPLLFNLELYRADGSYVAKENITLKARKNGRVRLLTGL